MTAARARTLRQNQTEAEKKLWSVLRRRALDGHYFRRQRPIGPYFVDFVCAKKKLIIELDGGQHAIQVAADARRTAFLEKQGYRVLRFWNNDVLTNLEGCLTVLQAVLRER
jgi:very-short-patch-repair endonuclease